MAKFVGENGLTHYTDKIESISNGGDRPVVCEVRF